jgi:small subunit ribosomal protein S5
MNMQARDEQKRDRFEDRVVSVSRVSKTVKGGRRLTFSALVVVGDRQGTVGHGLGKAGEVSEAVRKATAQARKNLVTVPMEKGTIPFTVRAKFGASHVLMTPASEGRGIVAGGTVRAVAELAGIPNVMVKVQKSRNPHNVVKAVFAAIRQLSTRQEYIEVRRGRKADPAAVPSEVTRG